MQQHHQTHLSSFPRTFPKPLSSTKSHSLCGTQARTPKLRFEVSATARLAYEPKSTMYDLLSVNETAGFEEIKAAYRKVALEWHPDTCRSEDKEFCTQQFIKAREAYRVLSNPVLRGDYDYGLQNELDVNEILFRRGGNRKNSDFSDWESQLEGLKSRSNGRDSSWGSRMRAKRDQM